MSSKEWEKERKRERVKNKVYVKFHTTGGFKRSSNRWWTRGWIMLMSDAMISSWCSFSASMICCKAVCETGSWIIEFSNKHNSTWRPDKMPLSVRESHRTTSMRRDAVCGSSRRCSNGFGKPFRSSVSFWRLHRPVLITSIRNCATIVCFSDSLGTRRTSIILSISPISLIHSRKLLFIFASSTSFSIVSSKSIITGVEKWRTMHSRKLSFDLINSSTCRHMVWYKNQSCSIFLTMSVPKVLQMKDARSGLSSVVCSKKLKSLFIIAGSSTIRCLSDGMSLVRISQATFGYRNRCFSSKSAGGSVVINETNSSTTSGRLRLQVKLIKLTFKSMWLNNTYNFTSFWFSVLHSCRISSSSSSSFREHSSLFSRASMFAEFE